MGGVRSAINKMARMRRIKALCPSPLKSILWEEMYVGLSCVRLFHSWPCRQAEIFFVGQPAIVSMDLPSPVMPCQCQNVSIVLRLLSSEEKYLFSSPAVQLLHKPVQAVRS